MSLGWKTLLLGGLAYSFAVPVVLYLRQYRVLGRPKPPTEIKAFIDENEFRKSQLYNRANLRFGLSRKLFKTVYQAFLVTSGAYAKVWTFWSGFAANCLSTGDVVTATLSALSLMLIETLLMLPFDYYDTFVIEEKFGFNKQTRALWALDNIKMSFFNTVLFAPFFAFAQWSLSTLGASYIIYVAGFAATFMLGLHFLSPYFVRWFYAYSPLDDAHLRPAIENLAYSQGFTTANIFKIDGSRRSGHSNAFFMASPWYKEIVLFDTLISEQSRDQILAVLAHELGHWKLNHITTGFFVDVASLVLEFSLPVPLIGNKQFYATLGFAGGVTPEVVAFMLGGIVFSPVQSLIQFGSSTFSRSREYQADHFAVTLGHGEALKEALVILDKSNLSDVDSDPWYDAYYKSHPGLVHRLRAVNMSLDKGR